MQTRLAFHSNNGNLTDLMQTRLAFHSNNGNLMHQSIPPAPSPPPPRATAGHLSALSVPGNFALPGGRAFANPRAIPELLTRTRFPIRI